MEVSRYSVICIKRSDPSTTASFTNVSSFTVSSGIIRVEIDTGMVISFAESNWKYLASEYKINIPTTN